MTARRRSLAALVLAVGALLTPTVLAVSPAAAAPLAQAPAPAPTQAPPPAAPTAVDNYGSCLASAKSGDLLLLFDQSSSLQSSDPDAARVTAASYLLDRLRPFVAGAGVDLSVGVAGFDAGYTQTTDWTSLSDGTAGALRSGVEAYRDRNTGFETDYWSAVDGARRALAARVPAGQSRCQALAWFSDGKLDISPRQSDDDRSRYGSTKPFADGVQVTDQAAADQVRAAAATSLCRGGGLADQLRSAGVVTFGIGLTNGTAAPADFDLMSSVTTGQPAGGQPCGAVTTPPPGQFQLASDLDGLLFAFDQLSTPGKPPLQTQEPVCQRTLCQDQHRFVLDSSIGSVTVLGQADVAALSASLVLPGGATVDLATKTPGPPTTVVQGGVSIAYSWPSPTTVSITLTNPQQSPGWTGPWALVFVDTQGSSPDAVSRANIHITGDLTPTWVDKPATVRSGEPLQGVQLGLVDGSGAAVDPARLLGAATLTATLFTSDDQQLPVATLDRTTLAQPVTLDLSSVATGAATLRLALAVTTADARGPDGAVVPGTALEPTSTDVPLDVAPPVGFPVVGNRVSFGSGDTTSLTGTLDVTGPGCVWVDPATPAEVVAFPEDVGTVSVGAGDASSAATCRSVPDGQRDTLPLTLRVDRPGNGGVAGTVRVTLASAQDPTRTTTVPVEFTADLSKPLDTTNFLLGLVAALVLGPGIPLALLYAAKVATSKIPARPLSVLRVPVEVRDGQVLRDGAPFALRDTDLRDLVPIPGGGTREVSTDGLRLKVRTGRSPVGAGHVLLEAPGLLGASSADPSWRGSPPVARLPLAVHGTWAVLVDPQAPEDQATAVLLVGGEATPEQRQALVEDMERRLPGTLGRLRAAATSAGLLAPSPGLVGAGGPDPFGGPAGPGPLGPDPFADPFGGPSSADPFGSDPFAGPPRQSFGPRGSRPEQGPPQGPPPGQQQGPPPGQQQNRPQGPPPGQQQGPPQGRPPAAPGGGFPWGPPPGPPQGGPQQRGPQQGGPQQRGPQQGGPQQGGPGWPDDRTQT